MFIFSNTHKHARTRIQETPTGLYISLTSFLSFGDEHVRGYYQKTDNAVFLHIFREKIELPSDASAPAAAQTDGPEKKITRLAIGVEGGFDPNESKRKYEYKDHLNVVVFPDASKTPYPNIDLPLVVSVFPPPLFFVSLCVWTMMIIFVFALRRSQIRWKQFWPPNR